MNKNARKMLDEIDNFLVEAPQQDAGDLWAVLSALRGPDIVGGEHVKATTTAVIRTAAFPRLAALATDSDGFAPGNIACQMAHPDQKIVMEDIYRARRGDTSPITRHFANHIVLATLSLDLPLGEPL